MSLLGGRKATVTNEVLNTVRFSWTLLGDGLAAQPSSGAAWMNPGVGAPVTEKIRENVCEQQISEWSHQGGYLESRMVLLLHMGHGYDDDVRDQPRW
ncbi:hypothetical protein R2X30_22615 [Citrobacter freundii]|uniref:hypothetical protein n=1 Tax=Citrobacter freundii TaxID=546 RepID=UPI002955A68F|nr:hypothetical protein [Citrobacter freundii]WOQ07835.1 hypothetical protein R2X30_22615 [Citrobacter freundii]